MRLTWHETVNVYLLVFVVLYCNKYHEKQWKCSSILQLHLIDIQNEMFKWNEHLNVYVMLLVCSM